MKILLDTNIVLDVLLARKSFIENAREIFVLIENFEVSAYLCASSVTTLHYLLAKSLGKNDADKTIEELLVLFDIAKIDKIVLQDACRENGVDYEDSVIYCAAKQENIDIIITRDKKGFKKSKVTVVSPKEFLALLREGKND